MVILQFITVDWVDRDPYLPRMCKHCQEIIGYSCVYPRLRDRMSMVSPGLLALFYRAFVIENEWLHVCHTQILHPAKLGQSQISNFIFLHFDSIDVKILNNHFCVS